MLKRLVGMLSGLLVTSLLAGCSANFAPNAVEADETPIGTIQGNVHGGNFPVTGAEIYLFAAGQGGYGTSATSLLRSGASGVSCSSPVVTGACHVTSDANGNFAVGGDYTCTAGQQVYMVSVGGNPGLTQGTNNAAIVQMAALGECPSSGSMAQQVPYLAINEVSTVAFAYAMAGFGTDAYHISSPGTSLALAGIENAMRNALNIEGQGWGGALATANQNSNSKAPQSKLNALANVLVTCVNTSGATSSQCTNLFKYATNSSGTAATDEATAVFNIVHSPGQNVTNIYNLIPGTAVFQPSLASAPADWTMPVVYTGVFGTPSAIAVDASGDAWIADSSKKAVVKISAQGATSSYTNGGDFGAITGVAVNPVTGTIWASDSTNDRVYILDTTGSVLTTITAGSLNKPAGIAFDRSGNGYVVNSGAYQVNEYTSAGALVRTSSYPSAQGYSSTIAVDYSGDVYTGAASGGAGVSALLEGGTAAQFFSGANGGGAYAIALDGTSNTALTAAQYWTTANNIWTIAAGSGIGWRYSFFTSGYTFGGATTGTYIGYEGGITTSTAPSSLAFDGAGSLWVANSSPASSSYPLSGFTVSSSYGLTAMAGNGLSTGAPSGTGAYNAVPDNAGNVWVLNKDGSVSQLLGVATPVVTPMVSGKFCTKP
jgi:hypothetical protein